MGVKLLCGGRQNRFIDLMVTQNGKYHGGHFPRHVADDRHVFEPFCVVVKKSRHEKYLFLICFFKSRHEEHFCGSCFFKSGHGQ